MKRLGISIASVRTPRLINKFDLYSRVCLKKVYLQRPRGALQTGFSKSFSSSSYTLAKKRPTAEQVKDLKPQCQACGSAFQTVDPESRGYFPAVTRSKVSESVKTASFDKYNQLVHQLDDNAKNVLLDELQTSSRQESLSESFIMEEEQEEVSPTEKLQLSNESSDAVVQQKILNAKKEKIDRGLCVPCRAVKGGRYEPFLEQDRLSDQDILAQIPRDATLIHVINALDFPASVNPRIKDIAAGRKIMWVVNKSDLIIPDKHKVYERLLFFVREELISTYGAKPDDIFVVSAKRTWDIAKLYDSLPYNGFLVGYANSGKTCLALALARQEDTSGKYNHLLEQRFVGTNIIPGMTREPISYVFGGKRLTDMPPIGQSREGFFKLIKEDFFKEVAKGKSFMKSSGDISNKRLVLVRPEQTLSVGGLVFIRRTDQTPWVTVISWSPVPLHEKVVRKYKNIEKALDVAAKQDFDHGSMFFTEPFEDELHRRPTKALSLKIPPGGIDLAVQHLCRIQLRGNGPLPKDGVAIEVYTPPGVHVLPCVPIKPVLQDFTKHGTQKQKKGKKPKKNAMKKVKTSEL